MGSQSQELRDSAIRIVRQLRQAGHIAYLAGGCVRDTLLGLEPKDYDVATDARPETVRKLFRRSRYVGEAFGVVLVYTGKSRTRLNATQQVDTSSEPNHIEVATFRTEWGYEDGRRPSHVQFSDAEHDAKRRDFTINGLFADPLDDDLAALPPGQEKIIDYVDGVKDLRNRILRAIGDPYERFQEDYLRMLRAARFAARLDFDVEPHTADAIRQRADHLDRISRERIGQEVRLMLSSPGRARAVRWMQSLHVDGPALREPCSDQPPMLLQKLPEETNYATALAAWMLDRASANGSINEAASFAEREGGRKLRLWRKSLCLSNAERDGLKHILSILARVREWTTMSTAKRKRLLAEQDWVITWPLIQALGPADLVQAIDTDAADLFSQGVAPDRLISGDDLLNMGVPPGRTLGDLLEAVYDAQLQGEVTCRDQALRWVRQHLDKKDDSA